MGRRSKELPTNQVNACIVEFAAALRYLRDQAGNPTLAEMANKSGVSTASLSKAAGGYELPSWRVTRAYVEACGSESRPWRKRWEGVRREIRPNEFICGEPDEPLNLDPEQRRRASWPRTWARWDRTGMILPTHRAETTLDLRLGLQSLRAYRSLSLRQLAHLMPYSHSTVAAVLSGARPVSAYFLRSYLQACGVTTHTEVFHWLDLLATADPNQQKSAEIRFLSGRESSSLRWRPNLPISSEINRLKTFSLRRRSDDLRKWLVSNLNKRERRAIYRRLERQFGINAVDLSLFERDEWELSVGQLNQLAKEARERGYKDIDPVIESVFSVHDV